MKHNYSSLLQDVSFRRLSLIILSLSSFIVWGQPGKNGPLTVNALNTVVNCYSAVTANVSSGSTTITTDNSCTLECGDLVMVYQAQGASIGTPNTDQYGNITSYNNSGLYEFNYVVSASGGTVTVQAPWANSYTASGKVQLIKVPQYTTLTVNASGSIVPSPWTDSGSFRKGGIVAIHATGVVTINGIIQANGAGFRAGAIEQNTTTAGGAIVLDYVTTSASQSAEKGESIAGFGPEYDGLSGRYGRGAPANGGGGGNGHNAGGGGGSNGNNGAAYNGQGIMCTACAGSSAWNLDPFVIGNGGVLTTSSGGGRGGYTYGANNQDALTVSPSTTSWGGDFRKPIGGYGGRPLTITPASRLFFGGGGGAGDSNNSGNQAGGPGGGMVYIIAPSIAGSGSVNANGSDALNQIANSTGCANDAPGGGGGGGTVILKSTVAGTILINAKGGKGGDQGFLSGESEGPGGGGGGGYVAISSGSPTITITGGANGITLSGSLTEFTPNGSTSGSSGQTQTIPASFITYVPVDLTATVNSPLCAGNTINFTTTVNYPGGIYAWTGPASFTSTAANPSIPGAVVANSGNYRVIYTSPGGCKDTAYVDVLVNPTPIVTTTVTNPLCNGACNGSAAITFTTNGTAPYTYVWSNGQSAQTASSLCAGTYTATITDFNGCIATTSATVTAPPVITATAAVVNASCNAACNGTITITAAGGTGTKQYSLNGGAYQSSNAFTGLCAGSYVITIKDANNCTITINSTITEPAVLNLTLVSTTPATCGNNNGTITVSATGGTTAYSYSIGGAGQPSPVFTNLAAGTYTVTVTDAHSCTKTVSATITAANSPIASVLSQQNVSCFGGVNGSALIGATGGQPSYSYSLNGGAAVASNSFTNLSSGSYSVTVTDANSCTSLVNFTITSPTQLTYTTVMTPASCNGVCDGKIQVNTTGGTAPFSFSHNNGTTFSTADPITGLCAGTVNLVVQDANGCLANSVVAVTQPAPLSATFVPTNPTCHDVCNGQVVMTGTGGTAAYQYSANGGPLQSSPTLTGLCAGSQPLMIQDSHGCQYNTTANLVNPPGITITQTSMTESNCGFNNGSLTVNATGLHPSFQYSMNGGAFQPGGAYTNLIAGAYEIVVMDAIGCLDSAFFGVNDIEMDGILLTQTDVTCFGGSDGTVQVTNVSGAPPITYELDNSGSTQTNGTFSGLPQGSHIVTIYDGGLCVFTIPFMTVQPTEVAFNTAITNNVCNGGSTGEIDFTGVSGGTGTYSYSIDNGTTFQPAVAFTSLPAGIYNLAVMDANSCVVSGSATITEATPVVYTSSVFDLTCNANNTGFIQLDGSGGNGNYAYSIDNGTTFSAVSAFTGLAAGTYDIVVHDQTLCTVTGTLVVNEPPLLTATYAVTPELCAGSCNGTLTVNAAGGTGAYQYSTDNGVTYGISGAITALCAGTYPVIVRDQQSCQTTSSQTIASPTGVSFTTTATSSTCSAANGTLQFTAAGGTGTYQYSIDNGATFVSTNTFTGLPAGTYSLVVQDGNNCPVDTTKTITDQPSPVITGVFTTEPLCNASCDGTISVTTTGGTGALQFTIGGASQPDSLFSAICAGTYTVTITDINGCADNASTTVTEPTPVTFTSTGTNLTCYQNSTGAVQITAAGGTIPYQYSYDNGTTFGASSSTNYIAAGTYNLVVQDAHNCSATGQQIVTEPNLLTATTAVVDATCSSYCDGTATVTASGGTVGGGYTYTWSSGVSTSGGNQASALCANSYSVDVTDQNGCLATSNFTVNEPVLFVIDSVTWTEPSCNTLCDGSITIYAPTGTTFSFDAGATSGASNTLANVCAGNYSIQVTNAAGCIANGGAIVNEPLPLQLFATPDSVMCSSDTIPLFAIAVGGTEPYAYTWDNGVGNQTQDVHPATPTSYNVFATDAHGCVSPTVTTNLTMLQALSFNVTGDTSICAGSSLLLSASSVNGYPTYTYLWSTGPNDTLTSVTVTPTAPTVYTISVTDQCVTVDSVINVGFYAIPQMTVTADQANGCSPLTVHFTPNIPANLLGNCLWEFSNGQTSTNCSDIIATFTEPGCYDATYTGTTADGCPMTGSFQTVACVYPDPVASFAYNPTNPTVLTPEVHFIDHSGGAVSYHWTFSGYGTSTEVNPIHSFNGIEPNDVITACLEVVSIGGCIDSVCHEITFTDEFVIYVPNAFTPDGDAYNNVFLPVLPAGTIVDSYNLTIFDRWGEIIFESLNYQAGWDGTYHDKLVQDGVYTWTIQLHEGFKHTTKKFVGHVSVLR